MDSNNITKDDVKIVKRRKIIIVVLITVLLALFVTGGIVGYDIYKSKKQQEVSEEIQKSMEAENTKAFNTYNDKINQIVASLNVEKDGTSSLDNNEDVDAMTNAVNELNSIANDVSVDSVLTQEQKNTLCSNASLQVDIIKTRINTLNEEKAQAEAARIEAEKYNRVASQVIGSGYGSWQKAYISYIEQSNTNDKDRHYELVYIDDDNQPELWVQGSYSGSGEQVVTYDARNDQIKEIRLVRIGSTYIPNTGLICDDLGVSGSNPISIFELRNGEFYLIGEGMVAEIDGHYPVEMRYEWEGVSCTEEELYRHKNELYDKSKGVWTDAKNTKAGMLAKLRSM